MSQLKKKTTRQILDENRAKTSPLSGRFVLFAHNIRSLYNVGSLFRSADVFGVHQLWLSGFTPVPPRPEISKTALGAEQSVTWKKSDTPVADLKILKSDNYHIYGLEQTNRSERLIDLRVDHEKICLVVGNEVTGIDQELLPHIDTFIEIPQYGEKHSLNVAVATGIALYAFTDKLSLNG